MRRISMLTAFAAGAMATATSHAQTFAPELEQGDDERPRRTNRCHGITPRERAVRIADTSSGFIYYVSVTGITGERTQLPNELVDNVRWLREQTPLPVCIGFGISRLEHVKLLSPVADGLIVGSGIMRRIANAENKPREAVLKDVGVCAASLLGAM